MFQLEGIDHVAFAVRDVTASAQWLIDVLGFERRFEGMWDDVPVFIGKGETALALFPAANENEIAGARGGVGFLHLAFRASRAAFLAAQEELARRGITFTFEDHEISHSIYFRNPDGLRLEITTYEV